MNAFGKQLGASKVLDTTAIEAFSATAVAFASCRFSASIYFLVTSSYDFFALAIKPRAVPRPLDEQLANINWALCPSAHTKSVDRQHRAISRDGSFLSSKYRAAAFEAPHVLQFKREANGDKVPNSNHVFFRQGWG